MTPIQLLDELQKFIEENTKDIILDVKNSNTDEVSERCAKVFKMRLPNKESEIKQVPYILLQVLTGKDDQEMGQTNASECKVRIVVATYSTDYDVGAMNVLNLITRLRIAFLEQCVIGEQFLLKKPLEYLIYPDNTEPYFMGEMMTTWEIPTIEREVNFYE